MGRTGAAALVAAAMLAGAAAAQSAPPRPIFDADAFAPAAGSMPAPVQVEPLPPLPGREPTAEAPAAVGAAGAAPARTPGYTVVEKVPVRNDAFALAFRVTGSAAVALMLLASILALAKAWRAAERGPMRV